MEEPLPELEVWDEKVNFGQVNLAVCFAEGQIPNQNVSEGQGMQDDKPLTAKEVDIIIGKDRFTYNFEYTPFEGSLINNMFVVPKSSMAPGFWDVHRKYLTIVPTPNDFQRQQQQMYNTKPKPFYIYGEDDTHCAVPTQYGLLYFGLPERDMRFEGAPLNLDYKAGPLWGKDEGNYDQQAIDEAFRNHDERFNGLVGGQISAPTGSGKTKVAMFQASRQRLNKRFIFVCHSVGTLEQNKLVLEECFPGIRVAIIQGGGVDIPDCDCALAMLRTLSMDHVDGRYNLKPSQLQQFGIVFWDEVHLTGAPEMQKAYAKLSQIRRHYGLSGTVKRKDDMNVLFDIWLGPMFFQGPQETRVSKFIDCFALHYHAGAKEEIVQLARAGKRGGAKRRIPNHGAMVQRLMFDNRRNALLLFLCDLVLRLGLCTVYFHDRVAHIKQMWAELVKRYPDKKIAHVTADTPKEEMERYRVERYDIVLGTHKKMGTGSDFLHVICAIEACPYGDQTTSNQATGRLRFKKECETKGLRLPIFHVVDEFSIYPRQFSRCRAIWKLKKFVIATPTKIVDQEFWNLENKNVWAPQMRNWIETFYTPEEMKKFGMPPFEMSTPLVIEEKKKQPRNKRKTKSDEENEESEEQEEKAQKRQKKRKASTKTTSSKPANKKRKTR